MDEECLQDSVEATRESYERIPYQTVAWTSAEPANLEVVARLYGLECAPASSCRVLEIGCGDGGNLVPLAVAYPDSEFVGVDLAPVHISRANERARELHLSNLRFEASSFDELDLEAGTFDYVIGHGILSWISPPLQARLFAACRNLLGPNGVAFLSYNTYPGWFVQHGIRDLLKRYSEGEPRLEARVERSRQLLEVLTQTVPEQEDAYRRHLESIASVAANPARRAYFAHEYLEEENHPFYLRDFVELAGQHGLRYVADADRIDSDLENMKPESSSLLTELASDRVERLQVLDYAVNRKFRQSLLCHEERAPRPDADPWVATEMFVTCQLSPEGEGRSMAPGAVMSFADSAGHTIEVDQPLVKAALLYFSEVSRHPLAFDELVSRAWAALGRSAPVDGEERGVLAIVFGRMFVAGVLELRRSPPCWATEVRERPIASPLVRLDAAMARDTTSLRHRRLSLENARVREVLSLLDGTRTADDLAQEVEGGLPRPEVDEILRLAAANGVLMP